MRDSANKLSGASIALHWIIGIAMIAMLAFGFYLEDMTESAGKSQLLDIHKAVGIVVLTVALYRSVGRLINGFPPNVARARYTKYEVKFAYITHWLLLLGTLAMPISGIVLSVSNGHDVNVLGLFVIRGFEIPDGEIAGIAGGLHGGIGKLLVLLIVLHVLSALKHHLFDRDGTLMRMVGKRISGE
jgi:cytochrome b561